MGITAGERINPFPINTVMYAIDFKEHNLAEAVLAKS
jgi:hypothetical protein